MFDFVKPRLVFLTVFAAVVGLLGFGLVLQYVEHLEPCPMCIMQRYAFVLVGLTALVGGLHDPALGGRRIYGGLMAVFALAGGGVAIRQTWIQHFPPKVMDCGPDLSFMVNRFPLGEALPMIFSGSGDCSQVTWRFLGLSIAEWAILCFLAMLGAAIWLIRSRRN